MNHIFCFFDHAIITCLSCLRLFAYLSTYLAVYISLFLSFSLSLSISCTLLFIFGTCRKDFMKTSIFRSDFLTTSNPTQGTIKSTRKIKPYKKCKKICASLFNIHIHTHKSFSVHIYIYIYSDAKTTTVSFLKNKNKITTITNNKQQNHDS